MFVQTSVAFHDRICGVDCVQLEYKDQKKKRKVNKENNNTAIHTLRLVKFLLLFTESYSMLLTFSGFLCLSIDVMVIKIAVAFLFT